MLALAYEDIGLANLAIGPRVLAAIQTFERLGMPEGELPIALAICDLAFSPKSNSTYLAKEKVKNIILGQGKIYHIPAHLRDAHYSSANKLGDGIGYKYPHDFDNNWVPQMYLPKELRNEIFYIPGANKYEQDVKKYWEILKTKWKETNK